MVELCLMQFNCDVEVDIEQCGPELCKCAFIN